MSPLGYWMPFLRCKTPNCFQGNPIFLPYLNPPEGSLNQPEWPPNPWKPFLICKHCGRGYEYRAQDVDWHTSPTQTLPPDIFVLYIELKCAQEDCEFPVKLYLYSDSAMTTADRDSKLKSGSTRAKCQEGYVYHAPLEIAQVKIASEIE